MRAEKLKSFMTYTVSNCDVCGREINFQESEECISLSDTGGYHSIIGDQTSWEIDICQHCFTGHFGEFIRIVED